MIMYSHRFSLHRIYRACACAYASCMVPVPLLVIRHPSLVCLSRRVNTPKLDHAQTIILARSLLLLFFTVYATLIYVNIQKRP